MLLSNESPDYAMYRALNSSRILPADKHPGVRPLAAGETMMRLISACNMMQTGNQATVACGNTQLCAGTRAGIEGNLHAVRAIWPQSSGWTIDDDGQLVEDKLFTQPEEFEPPDPNAGTSRAADDPKIDRGADPDATRSRFEDDVGFGQALFDAKNAFNSANRYLMLWNVRHRWNKASRFAFNRYKHHNICYLRDDPGKPVYIILSKEGTIQGDVLGAKNYAVAMLPLAENMRIAVPRTVQPWFADDSASAGRARDNAACLKFLMEHGPRYGYFPSPEKSWYICKAKDEPAAIEAFSELNLPIRMTRGHNYLGGFIGSAETKELWVGEKISVWTAAVENLSKIALKWPQTAYAGFTLVLQNE